MRVGVIHPGASFATHDVYSGVVAGLRALGAVVDEHRIDQILTWYDAAVSAGLAQGVFTPSVVDNRVLNRHALSSAHITREILRDPPDAVLCVSGHAYHKDDVAILRRAGIRTAVLLTESPYFGALEMEIGSWYDAVFTNERKALGMFRLLGDAHYLPHAYHPAVHTREGPRADACDVVFIGSLFDERRALLAGVDWTGIHRVVRGMDLRTGQADLVDNFDTAAHYRSAAISLNHHRTTTSHGSGQHIRPDEAESLGPRAYEIAACGGFQLMDDSRPERFAVFGEVCPTYRAGNSADLERQIRYYLARPAQRAAIAEAMWQAVQPHSWTARARQVLEVLA